MMPVLKFEKPDGTWGDLAWVARGEKGDKGDKGDPGGTGALDTVADVTAPASTPAGKLLGTTATGQWGPVDPPPGLDTNAGDARYLMKQGGGTVTGSVTVTHNLTVGNDLGAMYLTCTNGADMGGDKITSVAACTAATDAANKGYVDSRIWSGTQAQYDAIPSKDPTVLYVVV